MAGEEEGVEKHRDMEGEDEKVIVTKTGDIGYQSQSQLPGNSPSEGTLDTNGLWAQRYTIIITTYF